MSGRQRLQSSWHAEIATIGVIGARRMLAPHAQRGWSFQTINFSTAGWYSGLVAQVAQNDASLPYVPDLGYIFPEVWILLRRPPSLTAD
jgi:hypothetical protein